MAKIVILDGKYMRDYSTKNKYKMKVIMIMRVDIAINMDHVMI